ncbi:MAG TPA: hypothetical protein PLZ62_00455 [bacterium]|nr:hypothetical protein [bacterium]
MIFVFEQKKKPDGIYSSGLFYCDKINVNIINEVENNGMRLTLIHGLMAITFALTIVVFLCLK